MTLREHKKHTAITRPAYGNFARQEWAIVGTHCGTIKTLAETVVRALSGIYKCAYVDAQHAHADDEAVLPGRLAAGAAAEYTDQINYHQFNYNQPFDQFRFRQFFADMDVVLVNGNHQQAKAQVVVLDEAKRASLQKRVSQLTDVQLFLLSDNVDGVFDFVREALPAWQQVPIYKLSETDKIISFFIEKLQQAKPVLNGLVLAGGKSQRMGHDKGAICWHGKEQRYYMADLLQPFCREVYISCQLEQLSYIDSSYKTVTDTFTGLGPYGAILSAFRQQPDTAWLVVACDLPLLNADTLQQLVDNRISSAVATTFKSPQDSFPEPLITIWEPKSYPLLLSFLSQGYTCPRKVLINSDAHVLQPLQPDALLNVNTPEEAERVQQILQQKQTLS